MDLDTFLSVNFANQLAARNVGPFLLKLGVCRKQLLNQASLKDIAPPDEKCSGAIDDLRKSWGLHLVSAYRHGLYMQVHACRCSAE